jgi:L-threonate 2-dehydrogenase
MTVIGVFAQGEMGSGVGGRLAEHGLRVITALEGRSAASARRAEAAGMAAASWDEIARADIFISLVPPNEALPLARRMASLFQASGTHPLYADLNAINPGTAVTAAEVLSSAGCIFVDGSICGAAPAPGKPSPVIYASGQGAAAFGALAQCGLDIRVMDAPVGAASAVKICQSGLTKGYTALASVVARAAMRYGAGETLLQELQETRAGLIEFLHPATLRMFDKAYRFAGEMEEIAEFVENEPRGREIFEGFAEVYRLLAEDRKGTKAEGDLLRAFYEPASAQPG